MVIKNIETNLDSFQIYSVFKDEPYAFFLESGMDYKNLGRYSFIGSNPFLIFKSKGQTITVEDKSGIKTYSGNPFDELKKILLEYKMTYNTDFPFIGGAVGYFSYDLCSGVDDFPISPLDDLSLPDCWLGLYDGIVIADNVENKFYIASLGINGSSHSIVSAIEKKIQLYMEISDKISASCKKIQNGKIYSNFTKEEYIKAIEKIKAHIKCGDIYQANLTQRFECILNESPYDIYARLRSVNPAPFACFLDFKEGCIVSSSPERFIKIKGRHIETRPIKGTAPRGKNSEEDIKNKEALSSSGKDKAELLMIVDLERNDISKIAKTGTVKVSELFKLETYPTVYHLVSSVSGEIKDGIEASDCIKAMFPGGSITGAPKIRAMEIIGALETVSRSIYTGSIGYIGFNGDADLNIAIRTIICKDNKAYFQAGGGITWDSCAEAEYAESLHKARALRQVLENL